MIVLRCCNRAVLSGSRTNGQLPRSRCHGLWLSVLRALRILVAGAVLLPTAGFVQSAGATACRGTVYLTLDTGNMRDAELIAGILQRHQVRATFFLANEKTPRGDYSLDESWAPYWRARVAEGHAFGNHTFDHVYFRGETRQQAQVLALAKPQFGADGGRMLRWDGEALCRELGRVDTRFRQITGRALDPFWRAPGGKAPPFVMREAQRCGYTHVHWADAGFLGDELPSDRFPNQSLLQQALRGIRDGDILMAHLGIWSRKDPYAPMLDPLIAGLKARGLCFATMREHPDADARAGVRG
jgi:peptidoglycan/xylan/chitin deacetylase (PgdA/CDA1 family)